MTRDVIIRIKGLQFAEGLEDDEMEVISPGVFFEKNGRCYVKYDEVVEGFTGTIQNLLKFDEEKLEVVKKGITNVTMTFEKGKMNRSAYQTPFGEMTVGTFTTGLKLHRKEEEIRVEADYELEVNDEPLARCRITIGIQSRDKKATHLLT